MAPNRPVDMSSRQVDISRVVRNDHRQILGLFHLYLNTPADSRQSIVEKILHQVASHLKLEELLFQEIRRWGPQGRKLVKDAELEHENIMAMLLELQQFEGDDDQAMDELFEDMMRSVQALFMTEERDLLPLVNRSSDS
jgi:uncharacterized membrane protein YccC